MSSIPIVEVNNLSKFYKVYNNPIDRLKELFSFKNKKYSVTVKALDNVSYSIQSGDRIGILGENGSGKTTFLKILCNVLTPTSGAFNVRGRVSSLLELGAGFHPELTGRENFYQNGILYGYTKKDLDRYFTKVHNFSELDEFIDQPVKNYSSGMFVRLAFSCAVFVEPEILIIDEALGVGDAYFQMKCLYMIKRMLEKNITFIYVSHNPDSIKSLCNKGIMLDRGKLSCSGDAEYVTNCYMKTLFEKQNKSSWWQDGNRIDQLNTKSNMNDTNHSISSFNNIQFKKSEKFNNRTLPFRTGIGSARICNIELINSKEEITEYIYHQEKVVLRTYIEIYEFTASNFGIGIGIYDKGVEIIQFTSIEEKLNLGGIEGGEKIVVDFSFTNILRPGEYSVNAGLGFFDRNPDNNYLFNHRIIDSTVGGLRFEVSSKICKTVYGKVWIPVSIKRAM